MNNEQKTRRAFTLIELVVAVALLALILSFSGVIFKVGINSYRIAAANSEIMQKLRVITSQLDADFRGLPQDGFLVLYSEMVMPARREYSYSSPGFFRSDRIYYYTTDDFSSWFNSNIRSNIAQIYFGHDVNSITDIAVLVSKWILARDVVLLTPKPGSPSIDPNLDYLNASYAQAEANVPGILAGADSLLTNRVRINIHSFPDDISRLMCQNIGNILIEWTDGTKSAAPPYSLIWWGFDNPIRNNLIRPDTIFADAINESTPPPYRAEWTPLTPKQYRPKALKFTFTVYDSKGVIKEGQTFTHIVYLEN
jgi:prepilin-type N-terminal cleavage/methylation domain-containing protein